MATIKVYARVTPCSTVSSLVEIQGDRLVTSKLGRRNSQKNTLEIGFTFSEIFDQDASQAKVFDGIAKDVIGKFLDGYNGTIFAYGQTGTGKTYTIEGEDLNLDVSPKHGLIPQTLAMIFNEIDKMDDECVTVQISFLEMYNEMAYDLLGPLMHGGNNRKDLPRVLVTNGTSGSCIMHGLSVHDVCSEYEARRLHLRGRCNRTMAWTISNERSSRSHAVFMVLLTRQKQGSEIVVKSKLNLVDLAGSERLSKSGTEGQTLYETKRINLSLHHLETVILALQRLHVQGSRNSLTKTLSREELKPKRCKSAFIPEHERLNSSFSSSGWSGIKSAQSTLTVADVKRRGISLSSVSSYVPYRNSLLTMILQDSLGGNCNTTMIATLSLDTNDLNETISTCRFAQRVARVTNNPVQNKEISEAILIKKLKSQVAKLVQDLANVKQNQNEQPNSPHQENEKEVIEVVNGYIEGRILDPTACGIDSPHKVRACLSYLKNLLTRRTPRLSEEPTSSDEKDSGVGMNCDPLIGVSNDNTEEEPESPTVMGIDSGETSIEPIPSPPPVPQTEVAKKQRRDGHLKSFQHPQEFFPQTFTVEDTNCSTETQKNADTEKVKPSVHTLRETDKQLILLELEIKKENLIQKSKLLSTALANQKARVVVMDKHGCPMDELDNERLAEQQLRRKQAEVERLLSSTMKKILDTKAICTTNGATADQNIDVSGTRGQSSEIDAQVYQRRKLELKERSTRLRLLTCRQKLDRGLITTGNPEAVPKETESSQSESCADEGNSRVTSPLNSSDESVFSKALDVSSRNERPPSVRSRGRLPSARAQSTMSGRTNENKRKSKFGVFSFRSGSSRQPRGIQLNSPKFARKSHMNSSRQSYASPSNARTSRQSYASPSNGRASRQSYAMPSNGRSSRHYRVSPNNSQSNSPQGETQGCGKAVDRSRLIRQVGNSEALQKPDGIEVDGPVSLRSRRPAMCSSAPITNKRSTKRSTRPGSSNAHYQYDPNKGFILRTNEDVYRASNFRQPVPNGLGVQILDIKGNVSDDSSHEASPENPKREIPLVQHDDVTSDVTVMSRDTVKLPPISDVTQEEKPKEAHLQDQRTRIDSGRAPENEVPKGPKSDTPKKHLSNNEPKRELTVQRHVPPSVISARKQQIERARRIRQVTNAVEVIQGAYRRYLWRKARSGVRPVTG